MKNSFGLLAVREIPLKIMLSISHPLYGQNLKSVSTKWWRGLGKRQFFYYSGGYKNRNSVWRTN